MSRQSGQHSCKASAVTIVGPDHPDFGTGRLRLPASAWEASGIAYHRPVCCSVKTDGGTWRIYCISALTTPDRWQKSEPLIDAKVVLPAPGFTPSQLTSAWLANQQQITIRPVTGVTQNATFVKFKAIGEAQEVVLSALQCRLSQILFTVGCHIQIAPSCWFQVISCQPVPSTDPSNTLLRITSATQLTLQCQEKHNTHLPTAVDVSVATPTPAAPNLTLRDGSETRGAGGSQEHSSTKGTHTKASNRNDLAQSSSHRAGKGTRTSTKSNQDQQNKSSQRLQFALEETGGSQSGNTDDHTARAKSGSATSRKSTSRITQPPARLSRFDLLDLEGSD